MKKRLRFSLRFMLVLTTVIAVFIGYRTNRAKVERSAAEAVSDAGGWLTYSYQYDSDGKYLSNADDGVPDALVERFGPEFYYRIETASGLTGDFSDEHLAVVAELGRLRTVSNNHAWAGSSIATMTIDNSAINAGNEFSPPTVTGKPSPISNKGIKALSQCTSLESIALVGHSITDKGVEYVTRLPNLQYLNLGSVQITDQSIEHFSKMKSLESLVVSGTWISRAGVEELKERLPNCDIYDQRKFRVYERFRFRLDAR